MQHALHAASESGCYFWFVSSSHPLTHSVKQSPMLGPVSNQHRMTAIKQQVVLIIYSNPTPLALALCVSDAVLGYTAASAIATTSLLHAVAGLWAWHLPLRLFK